MVPGQQAVFEEILLDLANGGTILDQPMKFLNKRGELMHFKVDSNANFNKSGVFRHTRWVITNTFLAPMR